ncbi:alpha-sarcoglycan isoform X2 [Belonocnema kinseyi]|nr:alpha-sarcoglycan isoform X2 [Belonocnema kinseyi]XP_033220618.1 alpha-sarcoglycan isoform X2 [Belonocnema kinseyi]XP_033220619.1 alpha-sarcoglycan isoform X2 [Belonocnema kinseyi]XP_033220620.1 alpha-sarcoglycan isoform X2 [Belonocnema kinseyi]
MTSYIFLSLFMLSLSAFVSTEDILMSQVFVIPITPSIFGWNMEGFYTRRFSYQSSLLNSPDLPSWIHYVYSERARQGFLYGVAPRNQKDFKLEIVALDKKTFETRNKILDMNILENENMTKYEIQLKIDNLNVEDMLDSKRVDELLDIFKRKLWKEAADLQLTFLASAVELGARLPLQPSEGEGVVLRLGSSVPFSNDLQRVENEVKPLRKKSSCPRDYKRTSVETHFRSADFVLDWCSFRLIEESHSLHQESARRGPSMNVIGRPPSGLAEHSEWRWTQPKKSGVPIRSYAKEIVTTIFIPAVLLLILLGLLSTALCLHHEKLVDPESDQYFHELFNIFLERKEVAREKKEPTPVEGLPNNNGVQMVQYATSSRGTLRSLSAQPSSPNDSLSRSPRISTERTNPYIRPNPPPYMGPNNFAGIRADF